MATVPEVRPGMAAELPPRMDNLALVFQEVLTVVVRLRAGRQPVSDPESFRAHVRGALASAEQDGLRRGYGAEDLRVATFAVVAFLDESILNMRQPIFADWVRKPLQEEMFGVHIAGEIFFRNVERLLARKDSEPLADLLEIHQLCLLLGFRGRYSASSTAEIRSILAQIEEKIRRIRGGASEPAWRILPETVVPPGDRWIPILRWLAIGCVLLAIILFVAFKMSLSSSAGDLNKIAAGMS